MAKPSAHRIAKAAKAATQEEFAALVPTLQAKSTEEQDKMTEIRKAADKAVVTKASAYTAEQISRSISELSIAIGRTLSDLSRKLVEESDRLTEMQTAINLESARLKELHDIDAALVNLKSVLETQLERKGALEDEIEEKRAAFEAEMAKKRQEWEEEEKSHAAIVKRSRDRDEEEYKYRSSFERKKSADEQAEQQAAFQKKLAEQRAVQEKELAERKGALAAKEAEFEEFKKKVDRFPQELAEAVKRAEDAARTEIRKQAEAEAKLLQKDVEAERKLNALRIKSLEESVARQTDQLNQLSRQLAAAQSQLQGMALKAIEGASGLKTIAAAAGMVAEAKKTE